MAKQITFTKIEKDRDTGEYVVKAWNGPYRCESCDYFTSDLDDARATAELMKLTPKIRRGD